MSTASNPMMGSGLSIPVAVTSQVLPLPVLGNCLGPGASCSCHVALASEPSLQSSPKIDLQQCASRPMCNSATVPYPLGSRPCSVWRPIQACFPPVWNGQEIPSTLGLPKSPLDLVCSLSAQAPSPGIQPDTSLRGRPVTVFTSSLSNTHHCFLNFCWHLLPFLGLIPFSQSLLCAITVKSQ